MHYQITYTLHLILKMRYFYNLYFLELWKSGILNPQNLLDHPSNSRTRPKGLVYLALRALSTRPPGSLNKTNILLPCASRRQCNRIALKSNELTFKTFFRINKILKLGGTTSILRGDYGVKLTFFLYFPNNQLKCHDVLSLELT